MTEAKSELTEVQLEVDVVVQRAEDQDDPDDDDGDHRKHEDEYASAAHNCGHVAPP